MNRNTIFACVVCVVLYSWATGGDSTPSPQPAPDRPVVRWLSRIARAALWVSLVAEPPPKNGEVYTVSSQTSDDGSPLINHGRGW
jgi:hypothetical protein